MKRKINFFSKFAIAKPFSYLCRPENLGANGSRSTNR